MDILAELLDICSDIDNMLDVVHSSQPLEYFIKYCNESFGCSEKSRRYKRHSYTDEDYWNFMVDGSGPLKIWYKNGIIYKEFTLKRTTYYDKNHNLHKEDGPAYITPNGVYQYYIHGKPSRLDGPASYLIYDNYTLCTYQVNGAFHRLDGPAVIEIENDEKTLQWYEYGEWIKEEIYYQGKLEKTRQRKPSNTMIAIKACLITLVLFACL